MLKTTLHINLTIQMKHSNSLKIKLLKEELVNLNSFIITEEIVLVI